MGKMQNRGKIDGKKNNKKENKRKISAPTFWSSLSTVRLHCDVRIQVIEGSVSLFTPVPAALVHAFDFFVASTRSLVLLCTGDGDKGINGRERMSALCIHVSLCALRPNFSWTTSVANPISVDCALSSKRFHIHLPWEVAVPETPLLLWAVPSMGDSSCHDRSDGEDRRRWERAERDTLDTCWEDMERAGRIDTQG